MRMLEDETGLDVWNTPWIHFGFQTYSLEPILTCTRYQLDL